MPVPGLLDHIVVAALIAVVPVHGALEYRRLVRRVRSGVPDARARQYRRTILVQWTLASAVVGWWWWAGRPADALGFAVPGGARLAMGATVTTLGLAFLVAQWRAVASMAGEDMGSLRDQIEPVADFMPRTGKEASLFRALSVTAGICEEIVYRGYLIWFLAAFLPGPWAAALLAGVAFGVLHLYQGAAGIVKTGAVGIVAGLLFVGTGSLLWPMILHAAIDLQGGAMGRRVLTGDVAERAR